METMEFNVECVKDVLGEIDTLGQTLFFPHDLSSGLHAKYDEYTLKTHLSLCRANKMVEVEMESDEGIFIRGLSPRGKEFLSGCR